MKDFTKLQKSAIQVHLEFKLADLERPVGTTRNDLEGHVAEREACESVAFHLRNFRASLDQLFPEGT